MAILVKVLKNDLMTVMREPEIILYTTPKGNIKVELRYEEETFWLTQKKLSELFGVDRSVINKHISNIYQEGELDKEATCVKNAQVQNEGNREVSREVDFYNLDVIIAVGYRVNSYNATQFRIWATNTLKEFIVKGFIINDDRLKQGQYFGKDYFDELLERIRSIRASERRFYQKITDIYAQASIDYNANAPLTQVFYKTVQNKLHWAITGDTAAELISKRANSELPNMGLQTWKGAPEGKIYKSDVTIAKNYLNEDELKALERVVTMYLDYAENQASRQIPMKMQDWIDKLDAFLDFNDYDVLKDSGKISSVVAKKLAETEYDKYVPIQDRQFISDFDKEIKRLKKS
ncbi:virulence RhuM family protein [Myroides sp.]|uniref:virulence RhuM family protein n=1 Tax=Myroides sp. TaxID=1874736 RepID=UPI003F303F3D